MKIFIILTMALNFFLITHLTSSENFESELKSLWKTYQNLSEDEILEIKDEILEIKDEILESNRIKPPPKTFPFLLLTLHEQKVEVFLGTQYF